MMVAGKRVIGLGYIPSHDHEADARAAPSAV